MTEEKAKQRFKHWIEYEKANKEKIKRADELIELQETILKALEQKDKEIQELKSDLYECNNIISDYIDTVKEKDKIIGLMAEYMEEEFAEYQLDNIYAELYNCNGMERNWTRGTEKEIEDIIKYFEKKARKESDI